ncbi:GUN4 domain-containing protein [Dolichospermum sp. ST_con]|nr:GUN4 domain-containing protein [Dolichospermum sp. ST_con]MDD1418558.1 GUN4 domain-containing protein [Dolichospermum sp. ST_sed1]MDD1423290.1 GUN4 domain-containing protein [Dolichospermum sp. ST_sed9]MDD1432526.1 GUN4 domain-containing protein [Dolichospermum sp. ST_sed6]MDD1435185.1 GUN4 domain-containing protein [Dolichospermum sp. ST_sed10]MDD1440388.1 GUN4 domain-containing protein [Dolichospermum sp. ST_sed3]MDD1447629.1 GUN4 domain-containing protein [Dolichospermum sp. ST_sed8]MD
MIASDKNWKTPLGVYEKAIEELRNARTELSETQNNFLVTVQTLQTEIQTLKSQLCETQEKLETSEQIITETKSNLSQATEEIENLKVMLNEPQANTKIIQELAEIKAQISQLQTHIQQPEQPTTVRALSNLQLQLSQLTDELTLVSHASGMDYRNLQQLLSAQNWKDADKETYSIMLKISERENVCWLDDGDIRKFPRYDLHIINQLWVKYSDGKFGFSIQKQILQNHQQFTARCGWIENIAKNELIKYEDYNFTLDANRGHLPSTPRIVGLGLRNTNEITHRLNIFYSRY